MSVNVAIVEDESEYARELQDYLRRYGREVGGDGSTSPYTPTEKILWMTTGPACTTSSSWISK